mmetsp:Transcript_7337/g.17729  ORF Transcript_7337/g.17729 Transcript_7337/m.17729 type:complete len:432 (+) Transcript_7337:79-1374(+)
MGANRRNRQPHHQSRSSADDSVGYQTNNKTRSKGKVIPIGIDEAKANFDFNAALQEVDGDGRREITIVILTVGISVVLAMVVGIAAGMTISIHYFENQNPTVLLGGIRMNARDRPLLYSGPSDVYQRVTTLDPIIASSNIVQRDGNLDLAKVVTASATGQLNVLMVVDEITPLHSGFQKPNVDDNTAEDQSSNFSYDERSKESKTFKSLTLEQAERVAPGYGRWAASQPNIELRQPTILPSLCSDGVTFGFDNWAKLRTAMHEANSISAERFMKWNEYFATNSFTAFRDDRLYYEEDIIFSICPGATLRARNGPIFVNAENVVLECKGTCVIDVGGTHLAFGANAKNILIRGITFRRASTSSLTFFHDGADVSFEDCSWVNDSGISNYYGSIANVNSTSIVNFYRCEIGLGKKHIAMGTTSASTNSLSIRV